MQQTYPTTQSLHIPTDDLANTQTGYLSPNSISSDEACDSDSSDTSWPVISPVTSEDEYSATDSDSESSEKCWKLVDVTLLMTSACNLHSCILPKIVSLLWQDSYLCHRYLQGQHFDCVVTISTKLAGKGLWGLTLLDQILSTTSTHTQWETELISHVFRRWYLDPLHQHCTSMH